MRSLRSSVCTRCRKVGDRATPARIISLIACSVDRMRVSVESDAPPLTEATVKKDTTMRMDASCNRDIGHSSARRWACALINASGPSHRSFTAASSFDHDGSHRLLDAEQGVRFAAGRAACMASSTFDFGPYNLDPAKRLLLRSGEPLPLPPKAFDTLVI